jgi:hypothetical protein
MCLSELLKCCCFNMNMFRERTRLAVHDALRNVANDGQLPLTLELMRVLLELWPKKDNVLKNDEMKTETIDKVRSHWENEQMFSISS